LRSPDVGAIREASVARNVDEVVASLPAVRRSKVERRARELKSSAKRSQPCEEKADREKTIASQAAPRSSSVVGSEKLP
jgi:hypothetical protein